MPVTAFYFSNKKSSCDSIIIFQPDVLHLFSICFQFFGYTEIAGYADAGPLHARAAYAWSVETSIYVRESERKSGIGKALYASLEKALAAQNMTNLNACIASPVVDDEYLNHNSIQFHQHLGYSMVGEFHKCAYKFGRWYNMVWMEKIIADHPDRQPDVIPFAQIPPEIYC